MDPLQFDQETMQRIQRAKAAGVPEQKIIQEATQYQARKAQKMAAIPQLPGQEQPQQGGNLGDTLIDLLPLIGGVGGSFIPGAGTIVGGAAGAGLGALIRSLVQKKSVDVGDVAKEAALSGIGGVVGKGLGFAAGRLFPTVGKLATEAGESLATKAFRPSSSQLTKFAAETGEEFPKFLAKRGFTNLDEVAAHADKLQQGFDDIVLNKNLQVDPGTVFNKFAETIKNLKGSIVPGAEQKAKALEDVALKFANKYGSGPIPADELTMLRKEFDDVIKNYPLDEAVKGPANLSRDIFQDSLREAADNAGLTANGQSLKDTGVELSKLYKAIGIGERGANMGKGNLPTRFSSLLGGILGGASGGIPGAAAGVAGAETLNNPGVISMLSKFMTGTGKAANAIPGIPSGAEQALTRFGVGAGITAGMGTDQAQAASPMNPGAELVSIPQPTTMSDTTTGDREQEALRKVLGQIMFSKAKSVSDIKAAYDFMNPQATKKPLSATQQKEKTWAESGLRSLDTVQDIISKDPNAPLKSQIPIVSGRSTYRTAVNEITDIISRLRSGAALTEDEVKFYQNQLPQQFDSPETVQYKLNLFRNLFRSIAQQQPAPEDTIPQPGAGL